MKNYFLFFYILVFTLTPIFTYSDSYSTLKANTYYPFSTSSLICANSETSDSVIIQVNQYERLNSGDLLCDVVQYGFTTDSEMFSPSTISYDSPVHMTRDQAIKYILPVLRYGNHKYFGELGDLVDITNLLYESGSCVPNMFSTMQCFDSDIRTTSFFKTPIFMYSKVVRFSTKDRLNCSQYQKNIKNFFEDEELNSPYDCYIHQSLYDPVEKSL